MTEGLLDSYRGKRNTMVQGVCRMNLVRESSSIEELTEFIPVQELYLQSLGDNKQIEIEPFYLSAKEIVTDISYRINGILYYYAIGRNYEMIYKSKIYMIYRSYEGGIIVVMDSWLAENVEDLLLSCDVYNKNGKESWARYKLVFER